MKCSARGGRYVIVPAMVATAVAVMATGGTRADSSSPLLAAYYDRQMAIIDGAVYAWEDDAAPRRLSVQGIQVGVGRDTSYVLGPDGGLRAFGDGAEEPRTVVRGINWFAAGDTGVLAVTAAGVLHWLPSDTKDRLEVARDVATAAVGDGANYYVKRSGALFVKGKAHRGQYGDGRLQATDDFIETARDVARITAHTGHAILLKRSGEVMGTGGNIYGPVGRHGLGDKADRWSTISIGARAIATGASHSLAIRQDGLLVAWGSEYGPEPVPVMAGVTAVAAGSSTTIALKQDGTLWQWDRGDEPRRLDLPR